MRYGRSDATRPWSSSLTGSRLAERTDNIIVLEHGRIVEASSHHSLIALSAHYASLRRRQARSIVTIAACVCDPTREFQE